MASLLGWAKKKAGQAVDVVSRGASRTYDQINMGDGGRTWQQRTPTADHANESAIHQLTHGGAPNAVGSVLNNVTGIPTLIDTGRLVTAHLTHNRPAVDSATNSLAKNLPRFLPIAMAENFKNGFGQDIATAVTAPAAEHYANQEAERARRELAFPGADPAYQSAVESYANAIKGDMLDQHLRTAGIDMNTPTKDVVKHVGGHAGQTAADILLTSKLPPALRGGGNLRQSATLGTINAAGGISATVADPEATGWDYVRNGGTGFVTGAAIPYIPAAVRATAPAVTKTLRQLPRLNRTRSVSMAANRKPVSELDIAKLTPTDISGYGDLDPARVAYYRDAMLRGEQIKPILAMRGQNGKTFIEDGKHRYAAAKSLGRQKIPGKIVTQAEVHRIAQGGYVSLPGRRGAASGSEPTGKPTPNSSIDSDKMPSATSSRQASSGSSIPEPNTDDLLKEFSKLRKSYGNDAEFYDKVVLENVETPGKIGELSRSIARNVEGRGNEITAELDDQLIPDNPAVEHALRKSAMLDDLKRTARQLERDTGQKGLYQNIARGMVGMNIDEQIAYLSKGLTAARDKGAMAAAHVNKRPTRTREQSNPRSLPGDSVTPIKELLPNAEANVFAQNPMSKGLIIKEGPVIAGHQKVIRAVKNPETGQYEAHEDTIDLTGRSMSPTDRRLRAAGRTEVTKRLQKSRRAMSDEELMSLQGKAPGSPAPELAGEIQGNPSYPVAKKVNIIDYLRTPEHVLKKIGLGKEAAMLRAAEHDYKLELPRQVEQISKWREMVGNSRDSSEKIFQYLDGQKVRLNADEALVAGQMKRTLEVWADRLGIPEEKRITNYITHIFDETIQGREFDPDFEKLIADRVPGSVYDPYTLQRLGKKGYIEDAFQAMEAYTKRAVRKVHFDPALEKLASASEDLDLSGLNYVKRYGDRINMRPTEWDNLIDNFIKQTPIGYKMGVRPVARITQAIRRATYRASLGLNFGSAVRNLTQGVNTFAELGTHWTGVGYMKAFRALTSRSKELEDVGVLDNSFIEDRAMTSAKRMMEKADKGLFFFFETAEKINRGAAYFGAKSKALKEGKTLQEATHAGIDAARKTQFTFGRVDTPVALQGDLVKLFTQFQTYSVKQAEFMAGLVKHREFAKMFRFAAATAVVYFTIGRALGYKPSDMVPGLSVGGTPPFKVIPKVVDAAYTTATAKDSKTKTRKEKVKDAWMDAGNATGSATVPGFTQVKKTVTGVNAVNREQVKKDGKNYTIEKNPANYAKGALFGPYSLNGEKSASSVTIGSGDNAVKLTPTQSDAFNKQNEQVYARLASDLHATEEYQKASAADQKKADAQLKAKVTSANKRAYSADNDISAGLEKPAKKSDIAILSGNAPTVSIGKSGGSSLTIAPNLDKRYKDVLTRYAGKSTDDRDKEFNTRNEAEYEYNLARYENDKASGSLTDTQDIKVRTSLAKQQVGSNYSKSVRDLYTLTKTQLYDYLRSAKNGNALAEQLIAYDKALYDAGINKTMKYDNGIAPAVSSKRAKGVAKLASIVKAAKPKAPKAPKNPDIRVKAGNLPANYRKTALKRYTVTKAKVS